MTLHDDELVISMDTVRDLVTTQFPHWRELPVRRIDAARPIRRRT